MRAFYEPLSFDEQRKLSPAEAEAYIAFIFTRAERICARKERGAEPGVFLFGDDR